MDRNKIGIGFTLFLVGAFLIFAADIPSVFGQVKPAKVFQWKIQSAWPPPEKLMGYWGAYGQVAEIARRTKERSGGGLDIKVFPPDALFKALEAPDAVKRGAVEMICSSGPYH